ncbi:glycosyltransferase [Denitromonas sp. IR12]|uniref:Glycosyltransferase n=2 Tax=Denitromonas iodatirespirans TaxID=2795389 RepID=A0A944HCB1_DENI1|nr:glycosyltransferase [Denitromonas iodatirespirans]
MLSDVYFPRINGVSTSIETFRRQLPAQGIATELLAPAYGGEPVDEVDILRIQGRPVPGDPEDRLMRWREACRVVDRLPPGDYDAIHIQTPFLAHYLGTRLRRRHGLPTVVTYHTLFEDYLHHYAPWLPKAGLRALARQLSCRQCNAVDAVIAPSSAMAARLRDYGVRTPIHILPTGIPVAHYANGDGARFRARHGLDPVRPLALYVGRLAFEKNLHFLLDVAEQARQRQSPVQLLLAGDGPANAPLRAAVERRGLSDCVGFVGYLSREDELPDCYAAADAFVFASKTETQGLVLLEAMAAGVPVVCLAEMGVRDVVAGCPAARTPPAEPGAFAEALVDLLADPARETTLAEAARAHAAEWSDAAMAERLATLYRQLAVPGVRAVSGDLNGKPVQG